MKVGRFFLIVVTLIQIACAIFFVSDIVLPILDVSSNPINWQTRELLELGAALGLMMGVCLGLYALRNSMKRTEQAEQSLRTVRKAFRDHMDESFDGWALTAAERDVALFTLKGLSMAEIAELRETSEGKVKAQSAAIYRKAGVNNRTQLLSLFIDDLLEQSA